MPSSNVNCLFHADRVKFDILEKEIKRSKLIPRTCIHRLASAICSCRTELGWQRNLTELTVHKTFVQSILETEKERLSSTLISLLNEITETVTADDNSRCHLLKILYVSQFGDFSLLSRDAINNRKPFQGNDCVHSSVENRTVYKNNENGDNNATVEDNAKTVNNDQKSLLDNWNKTVTTNVSKPALTYEQYQSVARKRKMEELMQIMSDKLHFYGGPRRSIFHSKIKPTLQFDLDTFLKNYDFSFEMYRDSSRKSFDGKVNMAHSEIRRRNPGAARTVKSLLRQRAREKQPQLEYEKKRYVGKRRCESTDDEVSCYVMNYTELKDRLESDFRLKASKHKKDTQRKQEKKSVLEGGHCLNCLKPFSTLKDGETCKYHPGYLMYGVYWTCCYASDETRRLDQKQQHASTGCTNGQHMWRTNKGRKRKPRRGLMDRNPVLIPHLKNYL